MRAYLGGALVREEQRARVDLRHGEQLELERRDDAEVAAAAAHCPEQVGLVVVVDAAQFASAVTNSTAVSAFVWRPYLRPSQPTPPTRNSGDADAREEPDSGASPARRRDLPPRPSGRRTHAGAARRGVDPDLLERVGAKAEANPRGRRSGRRCGPSPEGRSRPALRGIADRLGYIVGTGHAHDRCRPLVVSEVEGLAGGVPGLVALGEDPAVDAGLEFGELR